MNNNFLTIEEKRAWLARIFRDTSGTYTDADKLKALEADNRLVAMQSNYQENLDSLKTCGNCVNYSPYKDQPNAGKCLARNSIWVAANQTACRFGCCTRTPLNIVNR